MKALGNARQGGVLKIAYKVMRQLRQCGEVALLLGVTGEVVLLPHWHPDYADTLTQRARHVCGVYRTEHAEPVDARQVCNDLVERWRELRGRA